MNYATIGGRLSRSTIARSTCRKIKGVSCIRSSSSSIISGSSMKRRSCRASRNCGEPCPAVCKKSKDHFKKDYEPYQTIGPLCGVFDHRAAERLDHHADRYGFDAISVGSVLAWLMECLDRRQLTPGELGVQRCPCFAGRFLPRS